MQLMPRLINLSIIGKFSTQTKGSKPFKPKVYQGRGRPLMNSGRGVYYNNRAYSNRFCDKKGIW